jgi:hypothetical protein
MTPDYTEQLKAIANNLSHHEWLPSWAIGLLGTLIGAMLTFGSERWKERRQRMRLEMGLCLEVANIYRQLNTVKVFYGSKGNTPATRKAMILEVEQILASANYFRYVSSNVVLFSSINLLFGLQNLYSMVQFSLQRELLETEHAQKFVERALAVIEEIIVSKRVFTSKQISLIPDANTRTRFEGLLNGSVARIIPAPLTYYDLHVLHTPCHKRHSSPRVDIINKLLLVRRDSALWRFHFYCQKAAVLQRMWSLL